MSFDCCWATVFLAMVAMAVPPARGAVLFTNLHSFTNSATGGYFPLAGLAQGRDGNLYGTTSYGGSAHWGSVFRITSTGTFTSLYSFTGGSDGGIPAATLVAGDDGFLYGTTSGGGPTVQASLGSVFKISTNGVFSTLHSFAAGTDGAYPYGHLTQAGDGNFYGTTSQGDPFLHPGYGTVFRITKAGVLTTLYSFTNEMDGSYLYSGLALGADGDLYGTASQGGTKGNGTIFKIATNGTFTPLHSFTGGNDGANPYAALIQGNDGNMYGTTVGGGANGWGGVFKLAPSGVVSPLHPFTRGNDGAAPYGGLTLGSDGNLYGTADQGGAVGVGVIFKITTSGSFTLLYTFTAQSDGQQPQGALVQIVGGNFWGVVQYNFGSVGGGCVFRLTLPPPAVSVWQSIAAQGTVMKLTWSTLPGASYQLQYRSDLDTASWTNLGAAVIATSNSITATDTIADPQRFYRVFLPW